MSPSLLSGWMDPKLDEGIEAAPASSSPDARVVFTTLETDDEVDETDAAGGTSVVSCKPELLAGPAVRGFSPEPQPNAEVPTHAHPKQKPNLTTFMAKTSNARRRREQASKLEANDTTRAALATVSATTKQLQPPQ